VSLQVKEEKLESLPGLYRDEGRLLSWPVIFILPSWIESWWSVFGESRYEPALRSVWKGEDLIGLAPLMFHGKTARLIGSADVCDYLDFIIKPGEEEAFFDALLPALSAEGTGTLILESQRPDAAVFSGFFAAEKRNRFKGFYVADTMSSEVPLARSWEEYLLFLNKKQRHEVRRKLRKLENESNGYRYEAIGETGRGKTGDPVTFIPRFLELFNENPDKADFMTEQMKEYFQALIHNTSRVGLSRYGLLEVNGEPAAAVLYFVYDSRVYLYNSGYHEKYAHLSVGLLSKILCIRDSVERGYRVFDFLKGPEVYKSRLGGVEVPNYTVTIELDAGGGSRQ
jgi:CelD/BcsL family acetyltransferase involved in cellulose biosynthesis